MESSHERMGWSLVGCATPDSDARSLLIAHSPFSIGRGFSCDGVVDSPKVSKLHAELIVAGELIFLRDLDSTNGTFVNGYRIGDITPVSAGDLIQFADREFRIALESVCTTDKTIQADSFEENWLLSQMNQILNHDKFRMVYQPIVQASGHQLYGVEALVRCDIPGLESPVRLFQLAANLGLEEHLSCSCRSKAVETLSSHFQPSQRLFLNTHPSEHLGKDLLNSLADLQTLAGQWKLVVEIHEAAVTDLETIRTFRAGLLDLGIELAYDDFGAGQSRLREISEVPPDYVKFDRGMINKLSQASETQTNLIRSLIDLCRGNNIKVIAEGIESQEDGECCRELGFELFQGYYYGRPTSDQDLFSPGQNTQLGTDPP